MKFHCPTVITDMNTREERIPDTQACMICLACIPGNPDYFHFLEVVS